MGDWDFPEKLQCFDPKGTPFERVFNDPIASVAYAQYRRKHIVSAEMNKFLPSFSLVFARSIRNQIETNRVKKGEASITLEEVVDLWYTWWIKGPSTARDERSKEKWRAMLEPLMPFFLGKKEVVLKCSLPSGEFFLETEQVQ